MALSQCKNNFPTLYYNYFTLLNRNYINMPVKAQHLSSTLIRLQQRYKKT